MSLRHEPERSRSNSASFVSTLLSIAWFIALVGCGLIPILTAQCAYDVAQLAKVMEVSDTRTMQVWIVVIGFVLFSLCVGLAIVFDKAIVLTLLLEHPESQRLLTELNWQRKSSEDANHALTVGLCYYSAVVGGFGGGLLDLSVRKEPLFTILGLLGGFFLVPTIWWIAAGMKDAESENGQSKD